MVRELVFEVDGKPTLFFAAVVVDVVVVVAADVVVYLLVVVQTEPLQEQPHHYHQHHHCYRVQKNRLDQGQVFVVAEEQGLAVIRVLVGIGVAVLRCRELCYY